MSFILDALRKSESERQRDATASLVRAPLAAVRERTPVWSWFLIALLSLTLLALTAVWWRGDLGNRAVQTEPRQPGVVDNNPISERRSAQALPPAPTAAESPSSTPGSLIPPPVRSVRELAASDPNLPRLRLELLAYNGRDPAGGSAWINGQRYFVGDEVLNRLELVEVRPDGVILALAGERFLLTTR